MHFLLLVLGLLILWPIAHEVIAFNGAMLLFALIVLAVRRQSPAKPETALPRPASR